MLIRRPPVALREAETLDDLREIVRDLSRRVARCEVELAGRQVERADAEDID